MKFLCIRYSGLKFYYTFETEDFIFIPAKKIDDNEKIRLDIDQIFSCNYEKKSEFYIILKEPQNLDYTLENFSEVNFYKFRLLESFLTLLYSNSMKRDSIFILEKFDSEYVVKKIFKKITEVITEESMWKESSGIKSLLWKNRIIIKYLQELIDTAFITLKSIEDKRDFAIRYAFAIDMYMRGKFGEIKMRYISDLWISLEVLSVITISHILHSHESFKFKKREGRKKKFFFFVDNLKNRVKKYSSRLNPEELDCWSKMKENFVDHMKNKINSFLPIFQKCVKVAEEYLTIDNIKVILRTEEDYDDPTKYQEYMTAIKGFKEYQDKMTIKKILDLFFTNRNKLFHGGKINDKWSLKFDRYKANFIKILEQLFFRVLGLNTMTFYQMGYPYQKIFSIPYEERSDLNLGTISNQTQIYIDKYHIEPFIEDFRNPFDRDEILKAIDKAIDINRYLDTLRNKLFTCLDLVMLFFKENHPGQLISGGISYENVIIFQNIKQGEIKLEFGSDAGIDGVIYNKNQVKVTNRDDTVISSTLIGMMDDESIRYGVANRITCFLTNPPYICFVFKK